MGGLLVRSWEIYLHDRKHLQETDIYAPRRDSKPALPARERPQTHALDRAATWTDM